MNLQCAKCKKINSGDARFCNFCGTVIALPVKKINSLATPLAIIAGVLLLCGFCGIFGLLSDKNKSNAPDQTSSPQQTFTSSAPELSAAPVAEETPLNLIKDKAEKTAKVISENANLRKTPSSAGEVLETLPEGASVKVIKQKGAWFLVRSAAQSGWIHGNTIRLAEPGSLPVESKSFPDRKSVV